MSFSNDCIQMEGRFHDASDKKRRQRVKRKTKSNEDKSNETYVRKVKTIDAKCDGVNSSEQFNTRFTQLGRSGFIGRQSLEIEDHTVRASKSYRNLTAKRIEVETNRDVFEEHRRQIRQDQDDYEREEERRIEQYYRQLTEEREEQYLARTMVSIY